MSQQSIRATVVGSQPIRSTVALNPGIQAKVVALGKPVSLSELSDVDLSNASDGALLVYNGTQRKFISTTELKNSNTNINGGNF
jgi:hypothetical protein